MSKDNKLKAYVRFDGSGRIVPSSLILQRIKPKVGDWQQVNSTECCRNIECPAPVYGETWGISTIIPGSITQILLYTGPLSSIEFQLLECGTNLPIASIVVPEFSEVTLSVPYEVFFQKTCNIRVRTVCGANLYSNWIYD